MTPRLIYSLLFFTIIISSCSKKDGETQPTKIDVSSQWTIDAGGNAIVALNDFQWVSKTFNGKEIALFTSLDTADLSGTISPATVVETPPGYVATYPNPFLSNFTLTLRFNIGYPGPFVFKAVVVDSSLSPLFKTAQRLSVFNQQISIAFNPGLPVGRYRIYYTLSSQGNAHFYKSWGNIQRNP
jgi:hypothetical protein